MNNANRPFGNQPLHVDDRNQVIVPYGGLCCRRRLRHRCWYSLSSHRLSHAVRSIIVGKVNCFMTAELYPWRYGNFVMGRSTIASCDLHTERDRPREYRKQLLNWWRLSWGSLWEFSFSSNFRTHHIASNDGYTEICNVSSCFPCPSETKCNRTISTNIMCDGQSNYSQLSNDSLLPAQWYTNATGSKIQRTVVVVEQ